MSSRNRCRSGMNSSFSSTVLEPEASTPRLAPPPQSGRMVTLSRGAMKLTERGGLPSSRISPQPMKWVATGMPDE